MLRDIAEIQIGYQHRDKGHPITTGSTGTHRIIQIKDLDLEEPFKREVIGRGGSAPYVWLDNLYQVTPAGDAERYLVSQGDVLFLSRGQRTYAVPVLQALENTVASYYFYILRPDPDRIDPEYLAWFINQPTAQACLEPRSSRNLLLRNLRWYCHHWPRNAPSSSWSACGREKLTP